MDEADAAKKQAVALQARMDASERKLFEATEAANEARALAEQAEAGEARALADAAQARADRDTNDSQDRLRELVDAAQENAAAMERARDESKAQSKAMESEIVSLKNQVAELQGRITDHDDMDQLLSEMERDMADTRTELIKERDSRRRVEKDWRDLQVLCEKLTSQLERKTSDLDEAENRLLLLEERNLDADYQIEDLKNSISNKYISRGDKLEKEVLDLRENLESKASELSIAHRRIQDLSVDLDVVRTRLTEAETEGQLHMRSAENLQRVLEEFQVVRETELEQGLGSLQRKLSVAEDALSVAREEAGKRTEDASRLADLLVLREEELSKYKGDVERLTEAQLELKQTLEESLSRVHQSDLEKELVDRRVVRQLLISYFSAPAKRRRDVLELMARMLEFGQDDRVKLAVWGGRERGQKNLHGLCRRRWDSTIVDYAKSLVLL